MSDPQQIYGGLQIGLDDVPIGLSNRQVAMLAAAIFCAGDVSRQPPSEPYTKFDVRSMASHLHDWFLDHPV